MDRGRGLSGASLEEAVRRHRAGDHAGAEAGYRAVLSRDPGRAEAWQGLGLIAAETGRLAEAGEHLRQALRRAPGSAAILLDLAQVEHRSGRGGEAAALLRRAAEIAPGDAGPLLGLATLLPELGLAKEGLEAAERAAALAPDAPRAWAVLGSTARLAGEPARAEQALREGLRRFPDQGRMRHNLAALLIETGRPADAEPVLREAIRREPGGAAAPLNLGIVLSMLDRAEEAAATLRQAEALSPGSPRAPYNLGLLLQGQGDTPRAVEAFRRALALDPAHFAARWGAELALPIIHDSAAEIEAARGRWREGLARLEEAVDLSSPEGIGRAAGALTAGTNFYLHYQGRNDRVDQMRYAALVRRIAAAALPDLAGPRPRRDRAAGERIRVGFASAFMFRHSVIKTRRAFITGLDPARFEVSVFHLGTREDEVTAALRRSAFRFVRRSGDIAATARLIAAAELDLLIYTDIGMDPQAQFLAALRLAPVQASSWGHPVTFGLETVDWFLSSERMEPEGAEAFYTEGLVRLPGIGVSYPRPDLPPEPPDLPADARGAGPVLLNAQSLFKLLPQFDCLYPRIAKEIGPCRFWFLRGPVAAAAERFQARLARAFAAEGLRAEDFVRILPPQSEPRFLGLIRAADLLLDGLPWSGSNSTMEALAMGRAVATWPQDTMRSRHTMAILQQLGLPELIAGDAEGFVRLAARLATDRAWRAGIEERIAENAVRIFDDPAPVEALARWIESVA